MPSSSKVRWKTVVIGICFYILFPVEQTLFAASLVCKKNRQVVLKYGNRTFSFCSKILSAFNRHEESLSICQDSAWFRTILDQCALIRSRPKTVILSLRLSVPIFSLFVNFYPRNINCMPAVKICACPDLEPTSWFSDGNYLALSSKG